MLIARIRIEIPVKKRAVIGAGGCLGGGVASLMWLDRSSTSTVMVTNIASLKTAKAVELCLTAIKQANLLLLAAKQRPMVRMLPTTTVTTAPATCLPKIGRASCK